MVPQPPSGTTESLEGSPEPGRVVALSPDSPLRFSHASSAFGPFACRRSKHVRSSLCVLGEDDVGCDGQSVEDTLDGGYGLDERKGVADHIPRAGVHPLRSLHRAVPCFSQVRSLWVSCAKEGQWAGRTE